MASDVDEKRPPTKLVEASSVQVCTSARAATRASATSVPADARRQVRGAIVRVLGVGRGSSRVLGIAVDPLSASGRGSRNYTVGTSYM